MVETILLSQKYLTYKKERHHRLDTTLTHEQVSRFEAVEANIKKLLEHLALTSVEEDTQTALAEAAANAPGAPVDPKDAEIAALKAQLAEHQETTED